MYTAQNIQLIQLNLICIILCKSCNLASRVENLYGPTCWHLSKKQRYKKTKSLGSFRNLCYSLTCKKPNLQPATMMKKDNLQNLLLDSLSVSIILLDEKLTISYLNPSAENLFDASSIRIIGLPILNFLQPDQKCSLGEVVHLCSLDKALKFHQRLLFLY